MYLIFFLSGAAGLVYELIWSRLLKEVFGVSAYATATVLATYLAGLAAGSWILGRAADRHRKPLAFYGWLEIGVAAAALLGTLVIPRLGAVHAWAAVRLAPNSFALVGVRLALGAVAIFPSTFLMGGTLPAMARLFAPRTASLGRDLGLLYFLNTLGAVCGTVAAGFVLIGAIGVHVTLFLAAGLNVAIGGVSLALRGQRVAEIAPPPDAALPRPARPSSSLLAAVMLAGIASLALEVIWTRALVLVVGSSTYAFATMLAAFLVGIAGGSWLARLFIDRVANVRAAFGWVQAGIAAATLATVPLLWAHVDWAQRWLTTLELDWRALAAARFGVAFLILLVPTTLIGMSFPLAAKLGARDAGTVARDVGLVYGANSAGNIVGAVVGGFLLLPLTGIQRSIAIVGLLNLAAAAWGLWPAWRSGRSRMLRLAPVLTMPAAIVGLLALWQPRPFTTMLEGRHDPVLYYDEGVVSTVKVTRSAEDPTHQTMFVDGVSIGESHGGVDRKQQVLAHFPFLFHRGPKTIMSTGLGSGILIGEVALHPGVASIDCVELSPSVIEGARTFADFNHGVLDDPRLNIIADDGVNFLKRAPNRYDVIIADGKSRMGHSENSVFYAEDYYRAALEHLAPRGLFIQWTELDEVPEDLRTIVRTFIGVFPHAYLFVAQNSAYLVGSEQPLELDPSRIQLTLAAPETAGLWRYGWETAEDVAAALVADQDGAQSLARLGGDHQFVRATGARVLLAPRHGHADDPTGRRELRDHRPGRAAKGRAATSPLGPGAHRTRGRSAGRGATRACPRRLSRPTDGPPLDRRCVPRARRPARTSRRRRPGHLHLSPGARREPQQRKRPCEPRPRPHGAVGDGRSGGPPRERLADQSRLRQGAPSPRKDPPGVGERRRRRRTAPGLLAPRSEQARDPFRRGARAPRRRSSRRGLDRASRGEPAGPGMAGTHRSGSRHLVEPHRRGERRGRSTSRDAPWSSPTPRMRASSRPSPLPTPGSADGTSAIATQTIVNDLTSSSGDREWAARASAALERYRERRPARP